MHYFNVVWHKPRPEVCDIEDRGSGNNITDAIGAARNAGMTDVVNLLERFQANQL